MMKIFNRAVLSNKKIFEYSNISTIDYSFTYFRPYNSEGQSLKTLSHMLIFK